MHKSFIYICVCVRVKTILQGRKYDKWPGALMNIATALSIYINTS